MRPQFQSRQTASDPDAAKSIYTAEIPFEKPGRYDLVGIARVGGKLVRGHAALARGRGEEGGGDPIPAVGTRPPRIHTPTLADVGGDVASIDTRLPPSSMHDADFADVLGKKPVVLLFATPQLCQSRVCGPVVDIAEQVKASTGDDVEFIHMEVFRNNTDRRRGSGRRWWHSACRPSPGCSSSTAPARWPSGSRAPSASASSSRRSRSATG